MSLDLKTKGESVVFKEIEPTYYKALAVYLEQQTQGLYCRDLWLDRFDFWWEVNPSKDSTISRGWMICKDQDIVGCFCNIPLPYFYQGKPHVACAASSWFVREEFRSKSFQLLSRFLEQKNLLLNSTPIDKVIPMFKEFNFVSLPQTWMTREALIPIGIRAFGEYLSLKAVHNHQVLRVFFKFAADILGVLIKCYQWIFFALLRRRLNPDIEVKEIKAFSQDQTRLFDLMRESYDIIADRSAEKLNWCFFGSDQLKASRRVLELRVQGELTGYLAVKEVKEILSDKTFFSYEMIDLVLKDQRREYLFALLYELTLIAARSRSPISFIKINPLSGDMRQALKCVGGLWKKGKAKILIRFPEETVYPQDSMPSVWTSPLDGDRCFFP